MKTFKEWVKKEVDELAMSTKQKVTQMQNYWNNISRLASDDAKKKNLKTRFGISNIKLDKRGNIVSFSEACCDDCYDHIIEESEYQGKKVKLNDPKRASDGKKKFYVYVKNEKGNVIKLGFGDPNMEIKRDDPARRKAFRARHSCDDDIGPKWKARYWSCHQWRAGAKVDEENPCWDGYVQVGMKNKNGKKVPNCVPEKK